MTIKCIRNKVTSLISLLASFSNPCVHFNPLGNLQFFQINPTQDDHSSKTPLNHTVLLLITIMMIILASHHNKDFLNTYGITQHITGIFITFYSVSLILTRKSMSSTETQVTYYIRNIKWPKAVFLNPSANPICPLCKFWEIQTLGQAPGAPIQQV